MPILILYLLLTTDVSIFIVDNRCKYIDNGCKYIGHNIFKDVYC